MLLLKYVWDAADSIIYKGYPRETSGDVLFLVTG